MKREQPSFSFPTPAGHLAIFSTFDGAAVTRPAFFPPERRENSAIHGRTPPFFSFRPPRAPFPCRKLNGESFFPLRTGSRALEGRGRRAISFSFLAEKELPTDGAR